MTRSTLIQIPESDRRWVVNLSDGLKQMSMYSAQQVYSTKGLGDALHVLTYTTTVYLISLRVLMKNKKINVRCSFNLMVFLMLILYSFLPFSSIILIQKLSTIIFIPRVFFRNFFMILLLYNKHNRSIYFKYFTNQKIQINEYFQVFFFIVLMYFKL